MRGKLRIKRKLTHKILLSPDEGGRQFRHGKRIVLLSDFLKNPENFDSKKDGLRTQTTILVAEGPTLKKGKYNRPKLEDQIPAWWNE